MNVVFDLGGVVFAWRPADLLLRVFADPGIRARVKSDFLEHNDWVELDRGSIGPAEAIARGSCRTGLPREDLERFLDAVPRSLVPIPDTIDLISDVRRSGNKVFVLSNMHHASIEFLEREHAIWDLFDGTVISCRVRRVKPETAIYEHLLEEYRLQASTTVFVDDTHDNVVAAATLGIRGIRFADPAQCRRELQDLGCLRG